MFPMLQAFNNTIEAREHYVRVGCRGLRVSATQY